MICSCASKRISGSAGFQALGLFIVFCSDNDSMNFCFLRNSEVVGLVLSEVKRPFHLPER